MKKGGKRTARDADEAVAVRQRTKDTTEILKEAEAEAERQRQAEAEDCSDGSWEDDDIDDDDEDDGFMDDDNEEEEEIIDEDDDEYAEFAKESASAAALSRGMKSISFSDAVKVHRGGGEANDDGDEAAAPSEIEVWRTDLSGAAHGTTGNEPMKLEYSNKAYDAFFQLRTEYPCLSFDIVRDAKENHTKYPLSTMLVCGTQADELAKNELLVLQITNMCRTKHDVESDDESDEDYIGDGGDSDEDDDDDDGLNDGEPVVHHRAISHYGTANRVRCCPQNNPAGGHQLVAVWSDAGHVQVFDIDSDVRALADYSNWSKEQAAAWKDANQKKSSALRFCTPSTTHKTEGYGIGWSPIKCHAFASGDCNGALYVWQPSDDGRWKHCASSTAPAGEQAMSVEEIQWSPTQADVLITARAGGSVEVWDTRDMRQSKLSWKADATDINVADWNRARQASHLLVTGADSGVVAVWDLRQVGRSTDPVQRLTWHSQSISSVEFSAHNESVLSVTSHDGQCTLWDLSLERDPSEEQEVIGELFGRSDLVGIPDQLMFQHQGLTHPKEAHWHSQIPGLVVTTDYEGLHLFRPMNWRSLMK